MSPGFTSVNGIAVHSPPGGLGLERVCQLLFTIPVNICIGILNLISITTCSFLCEKNTNGGALGNLLLLVDQ